MNTIDKELNVCKILMQEFKGKVKTKKHCIKNQKKPAKIWFCAEKRKF